MEEKDRINPGVLSWVEELRRVSMAVSKTSTKAAASRNQVFYILHWTADSSGFGVTVHKGRDAGNAEAARLAADRQRDATAAESARQAAL